MNEALQCCDDDITVKVKAAMAVAVRKAARNEGITVSAWLRRLIDRELNGREKVGFIPPRFAIVDAQPREVGTVAELVARGFTCQQIAAMTRKPYKDVLAALGQEADALAKDVMP